MNRETIVKELRINNQLQELARVGAFLEELGEDWKLPPSLVYSLNLAIEEAITNIIAYGYNDQAHHTIELDFIKTGDKLTISVVDDGQEFDPTQQADPDITLPAEERPIGGLGIFLIKKVMDTFEFQRKEKRNHLILTKIIK